MSSVYRRAEQRDSDWRVIGRAFVNTGIAYAVAAVVTFVMILVKEVISPNEVNPYFGQAIGNTFFEIAMLFVGSPVIFAGAALLDELLRSFTRPRFVVSGLALIPAGFWLVFTPMDALALGYAAWCLLVGLGFSRLMRLPPRQVRPYA
ncbi:MAG TPA: hypothetical protein VID26_06290 [Candidatus Limnocylindrales bacterium]